MESKPKIPRPHCVLKDWLFALPYRMQSVVIAGLRGCDIARKDDNSKFITRALRSIVLNNADPTNSFIVGAGIPDAQYVKAFLWDIDSYPMHFIAHLMHAAEIVGYKYPDDDNPLLYESENVRKWWHKFYLDLVKGLHLNPESEAQLDVRLGFTEVDEAAAREYRDAVKAIEAKAGTKEEEKPKAKERQWDAGTGTSHGDRNRDWSGSS